MIAPIIPGAIGTVISILIKLGAMVWKFLIISNTVSSSGILEYMILITLSLGNIMVLMPYIENSSTSSKIKIYNLSHFLFNMWGM